MRSGRCTTRIRAISRRALRWHGIQRQERDLNTLFGDHKTRHPRRIRDRLRSLEHRAERRNPDAGHRLRSEHPRAGAGAATPPAQAARAAMHRPARANPGLSPVPRGHGRDTAASGPQRRDFAGDSRRRVRKRSRSRWIRNTKVGRSYNFDFSLQRELPGGIILEAAYVGRMSRDLPQAVNLEFRAVHVRRLGLGAIVRPGV